MRKRSSTRRTPSKAPAYLRRQLEENIQSQSVQIRFINEQSAEVDRVNVRFDEEPGAPAAPGPP